MNDEEMKRHQLVLKQILLQCFSNDQLLSKLAFKGGTCLYFFYQLPRFSVDLDFDWLDEQAVVLDAFQKILEANLPQQLEYVDKAQTWFWLGSYKAGTTKVKVEINKREFVGSEYELKEFYGVKVRTMTPACMLAHKLCAIRDRKELKNRDLFDAWWMLQQHWPIKAGIIEERMGRTEAVYLSELVDWLQQEKTREYWQGAKVLDGLGQLLKDDRDRQWVRENLVKELLLLLRLRAEA